MKEFDVDSPYDIVALGTQVLRLFVITYNVHSHNTLHVFMIHVDGVHDGPLFWLFLYLMDNVGQW